MKIAFPYNGEIALITVDPKSKFDIDTLAKRNVPKGIPYLLVEEKDLPPREWIEAWEADWSSPDGYGE